MRNFVFNRSIKLRRETIIKLAKLYETEKLRWELPKLNKTILPGPAAQSLANAIAFLALLN